MFNFSTFQLELLLLRKCATGQGTANSNSFHVLFYLLL